MPNFMAKSIKLKNGNYIDSSSISHNRATLNYKLNNEIVKFNSHGRDFNSLSDFVNATANDEMLCGICRLYATNNFFNIDSADWVKVIYIYQNKYNSEYGVHGIAFVTKQSGKTYLCVIEGSNGDYTSSPTLLN